MQLRLCYCYLKMALSASLDMGGSNTGPNKLMRVCDWNGHIKVSVEIENFYGVPSSGLLTGVQSLLSSIRP